MCVCVCLVGYKKECNIVCVYICGREGSNSNCSSLVFAGQFISNCFKWDAPEKTYRPDIYICFWFNCNLYQSSLANSNVPRISCWLLSYIKFSIANPARGFLKSCPKYFFTYIFQNKRNISCHWHGFQFWEDLEHDYSISI